LGASGTIRRTMAISEYLPAMSTNNNPTIDQQLHQRLSYRLNTLHPA
jgi:hypothetical protein